MVTVGIDEVGRGCWAGPLVAGAVLLTQPLAGLKDSKRLTKLQRQQFDQLIRQQAHYGLGWVWPAEIDQVGLTQAVRLAMERAIKQISQPYDEVIIDGNYNFLAHQPASRALIKADDTVPAVSAASIIAKVARDNYMAALPTAYLHYGFAQHVGYGTAAHQQALRRFGVSDIHRRSFKPIKALLK